MAAAIGFEIEPTWKTVDLDDAPADPTDLALERIRRSRRQQAGIELTLG